MGGRGCPNCGGHNTEGLRRSKEGGPGARWCLTCRHRWVPCREKCRGYRLVTSGKAVAKEGAHIIGCPDCGVPDRVARMWPEAYRAMANELSKLKSLTLAVTNPSD